MKFTKNGIRILESPRKHKVSPVSFRTLRNIKNSDNFSREEKDKLRADSRWMVKRGTLSRSKYCQQWLIITKNLFIHHVDYTNPMSIYWLCDKCHSKTHEGTNNENTRSTACYRPTE